MPWMIRAPSRTRFAEVWESCGLPPPSQVIETSSLVLARGILMESDRIAVLSRHQAYYEESYGLLSFLSVELPGTDRRIGLTLRANTALSPGAQAMVEELRAVARGIGGMPFAASLA